MVLIPTAIEVFPTFPEAEYTDTTLVLFSPDDLIEFPVLIKQLIISPAILLASLYLKIEGIFDTLLLLFPEDNINMFF